MAKGGELVALTCTGSPRAPLSVGMGGSCCGALTHFGDHVAGFAGQTGKGDAVLGRGSHARPSPQGELPRVPASPPQPPRPHVGSLREAGPLSVTTSPKTYFPMAPSFLRTPVTHAHTGVLWKALWEVFGNTLSCQRKSERVQGRGPCPWLRERQQTLSASGPGGL